MLQRALVVLVFAIAATGCAYRTPVVHVPDARALDIAEVRVNGEIVDPAGVQAMVAQKRGDEVTRVRASVDDYENWTDAALRHDGLAILGMWPILFGMTYETEKVSVDVEIAARDGRTLVGHATVEKAGSLFAKAHRRALAAALDRALGAAH
jgi:hypothetical protein